MNVIAPPPKIANKYATQIPDHHKVPLSVTIATIISLLIFLATFSVYLYMKVF